MIAPILGWIVAYYPIPESIQREIGELIRQGNTYTIVSADGWIYTNDPSVKRLQEVPNSGGLYVMPDGTVGAPSHPSFTVIDSP